MIVKAPIITFETLKAITINNEPSPFNHTQRLQLDSTMNYFAIFQRDLYSFNNNALYVGPDFKPAVSRDLIPQAVKAFVQIQSRIQDAQSKGLHAAHLRAALDYQVLWNNLTTLGIEEGFRAALKLGLGQ